MISFISLKHFFLRTAASVADAAAVNPNGIKTLLSNGLCTFPIKDNPLFNKWHKSLSENLPDCPILRDWVFDNYI